MMKEPLNNIQIICAAYGRTGTTSLETALEILGIQPVYSWFNMSKDGRLFKEWMEIFEHTDPRPFLMKHIAGHKVISDFPICIYAAYIIEQNPQAKVILTLRDAQSWVKSLLSLYHFFQGPLVSFLSILSKRIQKSLKIANQHMWGNIFQGGNLEDPEVAINNYYKHIEQIKKIVPPEKLLEFNVHEGWKPLCDFLEIKNIPTQRFPYVNKGNKTILKALIKLAIRKF